MAPTTIQAYLHFGSGLGLDRLCDFTVTVFRPGFFVVRTGLHFVLVAMDITPFRLLVACRHLSTVGQHIKAGSWETKDDGRHLQFQPE